MLDLNPVKLNPLVLNIDYTLSISCEIEIASSPSEGASTHSLV
jgi:hypothetical protein